MKNLRWFHTIVFKSLCAKSPLDGYQIFDGYQEVFCTQPPPSFSHAFIPNRKLYISEKKIHLYQKEKIKHQ